MDLINKSCMEKVEKLNHAQLLEYEEQVPEWIVENDEKITKEFEFEDFEEAIDFVNDVARIAEVENHHPDIFIHGWNKIKITLSTHSVSGLSENDFIMATKIDQLED